MTPPPLLCISNGHGEDGIAVQILQELGQLEGAPALSALPLVGEGWAYQKAHIPIVGATQAMPSGGFVYMDNRQLARDVAGGLVQLTLRQLSTVRRWARQGGTLLAVGDVVPLAFAWWSGAPFGFIGTAKSDYFLRDEQGPLPHRLAKGKGKGLEVAYFPWERWLMARPHCRAAFVRDQLTVGGLAAHRVTAHYAGNPMMDNLLPNPTRLAELTSLLDRRETSHGQGPTLVLLPGSRAPEVLANWERILTAVASVMAAFDPHPVRFVAAIAPALNLAPFREVLVDRGWQETASNCFEQGRLENNGHRLVLHQRAYAEALHLADGAIATAGTATEQLVGLGKPAFTFAGDGPQFTPQFADAQARLLGKSVLLLPQPEAVGTAAQGVLTSPQRLSEIAANGQRRMGAPGAARRMAEQINLALGQ